jgi:hypothetical protein
MEFEDIRAKALAYTTKKGLYLGRLLGSGREGSVWEVTDKNGIHSWAAKFHYELLPCARESACYHRLRELDLRKIGELHIPQLITSDNEWLVIEMTLVARPFLLDFASVRLDVDPDFTEEAMVDWEEILRERFEDDYPQVLRIIALLRLHGIHMTDVHPGNLCFR